MNHERGRHDWSTSFYFDFLGCVVHPKRADNWKNETRDTVMGQRWRPPVSSLEGSPDAQVLGGCVTLVYPNLNGLHERYSKTKDSLRDRKRD